MTSRKKYHSLFFSVLFLCSVCHFGKTQNAHEIKKMRIGFTYGVGSQDYFPIRSVDYKYDLKYYKLQLHSPWKIKNKWRFEFIFEPSIYIADHQLLNIYYIEPESGEDYLERRELFSQPRRINEYVLNVGLLFRFFPLDEISAYGMGSIGPMISDTETERLAKGFAFSDILAFGITGHFNRIALDLRYVFRHVSNANIQLPNQGHNSSNIEAGILYQW